MVSQDSEPSFSRPLALIHHTLLWGGHNTGLDSGSAQSLETVASIVTTAALYLSLSLDVNLPNPVRPEASLVPRDNEGKVGSFRDHGKCHFLQVGWNECPAHWVEEDSEAQVGQNGRSGLIN